jgi:hypothetical protein
MILQDSILVDGEQKIGRRWGKVPETYDAT